MASRDWKGLTHLRYHNTGVFAPNVAVSSCMKLPFATRFVKSDTKFHDNLTAAQSPLLCHGRTYLRAWFL
jgi:hypothetical protein